MDRRNFLGAMFASVAGKPFIASPVQPPLVSRPKVLLAALWCGMVRPQDCTVKMFIGDHWIAGPEYESHVFSDNDLRISFQEMKILRSIEMTKTVITAPNGWSQELPGYYGHWMAGDSLKLTYGVHI